MERSLNFIEEIIDSDLKAGKYASIVTRFPPEPNGYLHIGHASSICLNFGLTQRFPGYTNLRFDDTNPVTEDTEYVESIKEDVKWLGFDWKHERYASDYFDQLYMYAHTLIDKGLAYVDDLTAEEMARQKGTPTEPGVESPHRNRTIAENKELFTQMKNGAFADGAKTLRARIDMSHQNMLMRDPILYRIKHAAHHRTGTQWCIYPMYDFAHGQSDSIEQVTHSICTLEFVPHRELYDWFIQQLGIYPSHQYEFARRNINYTVTSKRKLLQLVTEKKVDGWDDPRMPTISGLRRRGYTPESIRAFCERIGVAKRDNLVDVGLLEFCVREHLNKISLRRMVVFDPLKVVITNYEGEEWLSTENNPEDPAAGTRQIPFGREIYIEREDFMENPPKKYFRLAPGQQVRLKSAYIIQCNEVIKDDNGAIVELHCTYLPTSKSGADTSGVHVKGTLHWVSCKQAVALEVRLYDRLFNVEDPTDESQDFLHYLNPNSLTVLPAVMGEPSLATAKPGDRFQFIRKGYFVLDKESTTAQLRFNKTVGLKDGWTPAKEN
jgi:glutaminyl-tRNA synthetase